MNILIVTTSCSMLGPDHLTVLWSQGIYRAVHGLYRGRRLRFAWSRHKEDLYPLIPRRLRPKRITRSGPMRSRHSPPPTGSPTSWPIASMLCSSLAAMDR